MSARRTFRLDGTPIPFTAGQTIMDAALGAGVWIPHLCHMPGFKPHGGCRVCLVGVAGRGVCACIAPAVEDLDVDLNSPQLKDSRRAILQLLFVEGNHRCPGCSKSGACRLQALAYDAHMLAPEFAQFVPRRELDASHPDFILDLNRCILCELCVRASRDLDGKRVFEVSGRGLATRILVNSPSGRLGDSRFEASDAAARVCPVGAILPKHGGFEVPIGERLYDQEPISRLAGRASDEGEG